MINLFQSCLVSMNNRLIIFDLDGVLSDTKQIHLDALNQALSVVSKEFIISNEDNEKYFGEITTLQKLEILSKTRGLPENTYTEIVKNKKEITDKLFNQIQTSQRLIDVFKFLKSLKIKTAVASNSSTDSCKIILTKLGIIDFIDLVVGNNLVVNKKPSPEMYWKCMAELGSSPIHTIVLDDSPIGQLSSLLSQTKLVVINNIEDVNIETIKKEIEYFNEIKTINNKTGINVVVPMAGMGKRFSDVGYTLPKFLIDVNGRPMIERVVNSLGIKANYIYIVQQEHYETYNLNRLLNYITPGCKIVTVNGITDGAARTVLSCENLINNNSPIIIFNSDQIIEWDSFDFYYKMLTLNSDGGIATFKADSNKWSYARSEDGRVVEVAEKIKISDDATAGVYYWKHGSDFVKYAYKMIEKNIRINNEFYVAPVYNEAILDGKQIYPYEIIKMWGVGTPEDLGTYLRLNHD